MNNEKLRNEIIDTFSQLKEGKIGMNEAKELSRLASTAISSAKTQIEYNKYIDSKARISFFEESK